MNSFGRHTVSNTLHTTDVLSSHLQEDSSKAMTWEIHLDFLLGEAQD